MDRSLQNWLRERNAEYRAKDVPPKQRPWLAWQDWSSHSGESVALNDDVVKQIFDWFEKHSRAGSQYIRPLYVGAYYYDATFWPVVIPVVAGRVQLNARHSLKTMSDGVAANLFGNRNELLDFMSLWGNCLDYGFGIDHLSSAPPNEFAKQLLASADQRLTATVSLLLQDAPNPSALESSRMATEIFLKGYLAAVAALTEDEARRQIGHDLAEGLNRCLLANPQSELRSIQNSLNVFPEIGDRYKGTEPPFGILWKAYETAQFAGTTVCRALTGRDVRKTMRVRQDHSRATVQDCHDHSSLEITTE
jgi:hypothetical protein